MEDVQFGYNGNNFIAGGENVTEQVKGKLEPEQGKKPIALAVVLVMLVASLIFVVLFASKSIGYQQEIQIATGKEIVEHFKGLDKKLGYADLSIAALSTRAGSWNEDAALLSLQASYLLEDIDYHLAELFRIGAAIDNEAFANVDVQSASQDEIKKQQQLLESFSRTDLPVDRLEEQLQAAQQQLQQLHSIVQQFNFRLEGNRNAMIRLSSGFDWIELAKQMDDIIFNEAQ